MALCWWLRAPQMSHGSWQREVGFVLCHGRNASCLSLAGFETHELPSRNLVLWEGGMDPAMFWAFLLDFSCLLGRVGKPMLGSVACPILLPTLTPSCSLHPWKAL